MKSYMVYEAKDGAVFEDEASCLDHERHMHCAKVFRLWYDETDNMLYGRNSKVECNELVEWLKENRIEVLSFYDRWED